MEEPWQQAGSRWNGCASNPNTKGLSETIEGQRRPDRDDIARVLLHFMIVKAVKSDGNPPRE